MESRAYHLWLMASDSVKALAKAGRAKDLGDGSQIEANQTFCRGNMVGLNRQHDVIFVGVSDA